MSENQKTEEGAGSESVIVYTDGGCSGNPGAGGWACVIIADEQVIEKSGGEKETTNNRMELSAAINALISIRDDERLKKKREVKVFIDSQYVKNGITNWIDKWKKNGWKTSAKKPVVNRDLWEKLDALSSGMNIEWNWVKGHAGVKYNEICDSLCRKEIRAVKASLPR